MKRSTKRKRQARINSQLKKRLFGHLEEANCHYCQKTLSIKELTIEHLVPLCLNGTNDATNIALACKECNQAKGKEAWRLKRQLNGKANYEQTKLEINGGLIISEVNITK
jgi:5-methylcytosine-specific restriction endonuclease McrA